MRSLCVLVGVMWLAGCQPLGHRIMDSKDREAYSEYRMESERINLEREKAGLSPQQIQTFDEWRGAGEEN